MNISDMKLTLIPTNQPDELVAVPGYPGVYATQDGRIYEAMRDRLVERVPYQQVTLSDKHKRKNVYVHRLVALAFNGTPTAEKYLVRHLDGNPSNNHASNLKWGNHRENHEDAIKHGRINRAILKTGNGKFQRRLTTTDVAEVWILTQEGAKRKQLAKRLGLSEWTVRDIQQKRTWRWLTDKFEKLRNLISDLDPRHTP